MDEEKKNKHIPLTGKIGQIARLLREQVKPLKEKKSSIQKGSPDLSLSNTVEQIAKLLRNEVQATQKPSKTKNKTQK